MRRTATPAITAQMYRHFATLTVAFTAVMALFANGEKQQAVAAEAAASSPHKVERELRPKVLPSSVPQTEVADDSGTWSDDDDYFGQPTSGVASSVSWFSNPLGSTLRRHAGDDSSPDGLEDSGDDTGRKDGTDGATSPTEAQIAAVEAASRLRSGAGGGD